MKSPFTGEIRPQSLAKNNVINFPERFRMIAESFLTRDYPLAVNPDDEITLPRFKLGNVLAEAAMESYLPPVMGRRDIVTVRDAIDLAECLLDLCRVAVSDEGKKAAQNRGMADETVPFALWTAYSALCDASKEITSWIEVIDDDPKIRAWMSGLPGEE